MKGRLPNWQLWSETRSAVALVFLVEIATIAILFTTRSGATVAELGTAALLASLTIAYSIWSCSTEGVRRGLTRRAPASSDLMAIWTFPAAVILPLSLSAVVIGVAAVAQWRPRNLDGNMRVYRYLYSNCVLVVTAAAAHECMHISTPSGVRISLAAAVYLAVNVGLIAAVGIASTSMSALRYFFRPSVHYNELATVGVGLIEIALYMNRIPLLWLSLPAAFGLQRAAVRNVAAQAHQTVRKPMTHKVWSTVSHEVVTACATASVLRIDTDDPMAANAVAQLQAGCDAIGTIGRSGLAILLADCPGTNADSLALRLRSALSNAGITASVAVAAKPREGQTLNDLLALTEAELITRNAALKSGDLDQPETSS